LRHLADGFLLRVERLDQLLGMLDVAALLVQVQFAQLHLVLGANSFSGKEPVGKDRGLENTDQCTSGLPRYSPARPMGSLASTVQRRLPSFLSASRMATLTSLSAGDGLALLRRRLQVEVGPGRQLLHLTFAVPSWATLTH